MNDIRTSSQYLANLPKTEAASRESETVTRIMSMKVSDIVEPGAYTVTDFANLVENGIWIASTFAFYDLDDELREAEFLEIPTIFDGMFDEMIAEMLDDVPKVKIPEKTVRSYDMDARGRIIITEEPVETPIRDTEAKETFQDGELIKKRLSKQDELLAEAISLETDVKIIEGYLTKIRSNPVERDVEAESRIMSVLLNRRGFLDTWISAKKMLLTASNDR